MKKIFVLILTTIVTLFILNLFSDQINTFIIFLFEIILNGKTKLYHANLDYSINDLGIKILIQKGHLSNSLNNAIARTNMHLFFPIALFAGITSYNFNRKSLKIFVIMSLIALMFFIFKTNILVTDHLMRDTVFGQNGQILSVLKNPSNKERLIASLNDIFNLNGSIYSKYYFLIASYLVTYKIIFNVKIRSLKIFRLITK